MSPLWIDWRDLERHPYGCTLRPCEERAEALLDGEPFCLDCADLVIERACIPRDQRGGFPSLADRVPGI